jgi:predicted ATPase/DNA-binding XRE family transcriptional regulator
MPDRTNVETYTSFGALLKYLRMRANLNQAEFALAVGYSVGQISRLEKNHRAPDITAVAAKFIPVLELDDAPALAERLLELAKSSRHPPEAHATLMVSAPVWQPTPLPALATPLIGRNAEIDAIDRLFQQGIRLITLIGPPGVGKTRLAIAAAEHVARRTGQQAAFVDLALVADPTMVLAAIAGALRIRETRGQSLLQMLMTALAGQAPILILDTMEQLIEAAASLADLVAACPALCVIVTSRLPLQIRAEWSYPVQPLPLPFNYEPMVVAHAPASELFIDRAAAVGVNLVLDAIIAEQIAQICHRLNGLPLAIELAAAQMRRFTPQQLLAQLTKQGLLRVLRSELRDVPARHRTIQATIEWSIALLTEAEQTLLARLSVFRTSWASDAILHICSDTPAEPATIQQQPIDDLLIQLVNHNLVQQMQTTTSQRRYRLLEVVREYAKEHLQRRGEAQQLAYRYTMYYLALENQARTNYDHGTVDAFRQIHEDLDNIQDALMWALKSGHIEAAALAVIGLGSFWASRMPVALQWLEEVIAHAEQLQPALRASVFAMMGTQSWEVFRNPRRAQELCELSLALYREAADQHGVARVLAGLAHISMAIGQVDRQQTTAYLAESLEIRRSMADREGIAEALVAQARLAGLYYDFAQAQACLIDSMAIRQSIDDPLGIAVTLFFEGWLAFRRADYVSTFAISRERLAIEVAMGNPQGIADCTMWQGMALLWQRQYQQAAELLESALRHMRTLAEPRHLPQILDACGHAAQLIGHLELAQQYYEERITLLKLFNARRGIAWAQIQRAALALQRAVPAECANYLRAAQTTLSNRLDPYGPTHLFVDPAPFRHEAGLILLIETWASWAHALGIVETPLRLIAATRTLRSNYHVPFLFPDEYDRVQQIITTAKACFEQTSYDAVWHSGSQLSLMEALASAQDLSKADLLG